MEKEPKITTYTKIAQSLRNSREKKDSYRTDCEDFFYSNVEGTNTQFTAKQLAVIEQDYNIPLTLNICYPIVEQVLAFLIGNKPSARVVPIGEADKNTAYIFQELWSGIWYKSDGASKLREAMKDCLISGTGWLFIEPTNFYHDNPFGVNISYVPWGYVYTDPNAKDWDYADAEYIMVSKSMSMNKARNIYGDLFDSKENAPMGWGYDLGGGREYYDEIGEGIDGTKPINICDIYEKRYLNKDGFIAEDGKIYPSPPLDKTMKFSPVKRGVYIYRTLFIENRKILWEGFLPVKEYPLVSFTAVHRPKGKEGNETYGIVHFIRNPQEAINKTVAHIILNAQTHANAKLLIPDGMVDPQKVYDWAADPRRPLTFTPDPTFPNLKPERILPVPLANAHYTLFQELIKMVEYITGVYSVMQGNPTDAPTTFGGTQSLQVYGTQRIKLRASMMDISIAKLCSCAINYISFYSEEGKVFRYINDEMTANVQDPETGEMQQQVVKSNEPWRNVKLIKVPNVGDYDVIATPNPSTPTTRMLASQLLAMISGQTADPNVANLLTQYALKLMDIPEADEIVQKVDIVSNLQQQLQQLQQAMEQAGQQVEQLSTENQDLKQEIMEKDYETKLSAVSAKAEADIDKQKALAENAIENSKANAEEELEPEESAFIQ